MNNAYIMPIAVVLEILMLFGFGIHLIRRLTLLQARINYIKRSLQLIEFYQNQSIKFLTQNHGFCIKEIPDSFGDEIEQIDTGF